MSESAAALLAYLDLARWGDGPQATNEISARRSARLSGEPGTLADRAEETLNGLVRALAGVAAGASAAAESGGAIARSSRLRAMVDAARVEASSTRNAECERAPTTMTIGVNTVRSAA